MDRNIFSAVFGAEHDSTFSDESELCKMFKYAKNIIFGLGLLFVSTVIAEEQYEPLYPFDNIELKNIAKSVSEQDL